MNNKGHFLIKNDLSQGNTQVLFDIVWQLKFDEILWLTTTGTKNHVLVSSGPPRAEN